MRVLDGGKMAVAVSPVGGAGGVLDSKNQTAPAPTPSVLRAARRTRLHLPPALLSVCPKTQAGRQIRKLALGRAAGAGYGRGRCCRLHHPTPQRRIEAIITDCTVYPPLYYPPPVTSRALPGADYA
jgi:hypothetical protein